MTLTIKHGFNVAIADDPTAAAAGEVLPSHWNANHSITGVPDLTIGTSAILGGVNTRVLFDRAGVVGEAVNFNIVNGTQTNPSSSINAVDAPLAIGGDVVGAPTSPGQGYLLKNASGVWSALWSQSTFPGVQNDNWYIAGAGNVANGTAGYSNFGMGANALSFSTSGNNNFAMGPSVMSFCSGSNNVGVGSSSLVDVLSGSNNTAIGTSALNAMSGSNNTAIGFQAGAGAAVSTTPARNVIIGNSAGYLITGTGNVVIGGGDNSTILTGFTITTGGQNIVIGYGCDVSSASANGQLSIGNFIYGTGLTGTGSTISSGWIGVGLKAKVQSEVLATAGSIYIHNGATASNNSSADSLTLSANGNALGSYNSPANDGAGFAFNQGNAGGTSGNGFNVIGVVGTNSEAVYGLDTTNSGLNNGDFTLQTFFSAAFQNIFNVPVGTNQLRVSNAVAVKGDPGGTASFNTISGTNSTTIGAGTGTVKMSSANNANNTGWLKCYIGTQVAWIPCWTTNAP